MTFWSKTTFYKQKHQYNKKSSEHKLEVGSREIGQVMGKAGKFARPYFGSCLPTSIKHHISLSAGGHFNLQWYSEQVTNQLEGRDLNELEGAE